MFITLVSLILNFNIDLRKFELWYFPNIFLSEDYELAQPSPNI